MKFGARIQKIKVIWNIFRYYLPKLHVFTHSFHLHPPCPSSPPTKFHVLRPWSQWWQYFRKILETLGEASLEKTGPWEYILRGSILSLTPILPFSRLLSVCLYVSFCCICFSPPSPHTLPLPTHTSLPKHTTVSGDILPHIIVATSRLNPLTMSRKESVSYGCFQEFVRMTRK